MPNRPDIRSESAAVEDYLEQIHRLIEEKGYARQVDIASSLGVSAASVSNMVTRLDALGLIIAERYRGLRLTEEGNRVGQAIRHRHQLLTRLLSHLGLEEKIVFEDVEGMEHHLSPQTVKALEILTEELESQPAMLKRIREKLS